MKHFCRLLALTLAIAAVFTCAMAGENDLDKTKINKVEAYIQEEQPMEFDIGQTKFSVKQLKRLMASMPEGSTFRFTIWYCNSWIDSESEVLDLDNGKAKVTEDDLRWFLENMPNVKTVNSFNHRELDNKIIVPLMEEYPEIQFNWLVYISSKYRLRSDATAFSTQKKVGEKPDLTEKSFENLKYVPGLKALDIGHNAVKDLTWLQYLPELEVLILADNEITDITPIAQLEKLEYVELFMNNIKDVTPLAGLKNLRDLNLCRTKLQDTDLSVLDGLELERFWCTQAGVSKEQQTRYIEANPETNANFTIGSCTDNGWRDSYKYKQFRAMFKNRTWADFVRPEQE
ncbi:MAG: leucine-rich repeat domain-containing protein [Clostridiales bacterium]|nr:leucine-rich repeat domain-containing protein [Clostridiales bacterium]